MLRKCASNSHSYTHLIQALGIVRKPTVWVFITSEYPGTHDIGLARARLARVTPAGLDDLGAREEAVPAAVNALERGSQHRVHPGTA